MLLVEGSMGASSMACSKLSLDFTQAYVNRNKLQSIGLQVAHDAVSSAKSRQ